MMQLGNPAQAGDILKRARSCALRRERRCILPTHPLLLNALDIATRSMM
jgi:hypothetical protein